MRRYILARIVQAIFTIFAVTVLVFFVMRFTGDPMSMIVPPDAGKEEIKALKRKYGLDKPVIFQFVLFVKRAIRGDFGESFKWQQPALPLVLKRFPATMQLGATAALVAWCIGIPLGMVSAVKRDSVIDRFGKIFALIGQATPDFWLGVMLMLLFGVKLRWLPISGRIGLESLVMPALTISFIMLASITRLSRSAMLDTLSAEFITMAHIKGVPLIWILIVHAFKNAFIPVLTLMSLQISYLFMGAVIAETIFSWPGIGKLALEAVFARDYPVVQVLVLFSAFIFCAVNILVDVLYAYIDPRIKYGKV
jgi:peptide/nickel transport system permease protein